MNLWKKLAVLVLGLAFLTTEARDPDQSFSDDDIIDITDNFTVNGRHGPRNLLPGIVGHTYFTRSIGAIESEKRCKELVETMKAEWIDAQLNSDDFVYDFSLYCEEIRMGHKALLVDLTIEPASQEKVQSLANWIQAIELEKPLGLELSFKLLKRLEIEKSFTGIHLIEGRPEPVHSYNIVSSKISSFKNYHQFRMHLILEQSGLSKVRSIEPVVDYLSHFLHPNEMKVFEERGLRKSNILMITNRMRNVLIDGNKVDAMAKTENRSLALCTFFGTELCQE